MEVVHPRCAGIDVSKRDAKVCVRVPGHGRGGVVDGDDVGFDHQPGPRAAGAPDRRAGHVVVMEATGDYWKPFYYLLEDGPRGDAGQRPRGEEPARPQDRRVRRGVAGPARGPRAGPGSFVPPQPVRQLRDLTRTRTAITRERAREVQRLEKLLEDAGIKLSSVATDITGVSGRAMLEALIAGQRDPPRSPIWPNGGCARRSPR